MKYEITQSEIEGLLVKQLSNFFPIDEREKKLICDCMPDVLSKCDTNFKRNVVIFENAIT